MSFQRKNRVVVSGRRRPIQQISIESPLPSGTTETEVHNESFHSSTLINNTGNSRVPPGRVPTGRLGAVPPRSPISVSAGAAVNRGAMPFMMNSHHGTRETSKVNTIKETTRKKPNASITDNIAIYPSIISSDTGCVSTGCGDLDKLLGHGGIPLSTSMLIKEQQCTDYSSMLMKYFITQGVIHDRIYKKKAHSSRRGDSKGCHVIVVGISGLMRDLPGLYLGSKKEVKKRLVKEQENKLSVSNLVDTQQQESNTHQNKSMKIAWRYGLNDNKDSKKKSDNVLDDNKRPDYNHLFDLGTRLDPPVNSTEISYVNVFDSEGLTKVVGEIEKIVKSQNERVIIRIAMPNLLNPGMFPASAFASNEILPFLMSLKALVNKRRNVCLMSSMQTSLFMGDHYSILSVVENLFNSVIELDPFNQDLLKFLERSYKKEPTKIQQGFVNVWKIHYLSDIGNMVIKKNEFAFRNGKRHFEISEWSIPVDEEEQEAENSSTTKNIDF